ncbi:TPA: hypothetical protein ACH3X1_015860 [Trebouxia sp. C0004]
MATHKLCAQPDLQQNLCFTRLEKLLGRDSFLLFTVRLGMHTGKLPEATGLKYGALSLITVANKHSQKMASFNALNIAGLPACRLNDYIEPHLIDDVKPIHMIVTTPDWFDTLYQKQSVRKQDSAQFQTGVLRLDLSSVFDRLRLELGEAASGLDDLEAMAISADVNEGIFVMEPRHPVKHP